MDYVKLADVAPAVLKTARHKLGTPLDVFTRGGLAGAILAAATRPSARSPAPISIFIFLPQGYQHSVVNMFIIPTGMMLGAKITVGEWWIWNQLR